MKKQNKLRQTQSRRTVPMSPRPLKKPACKLPEKQCTIKTQYGQKDMERHILTHTGERPFDCELCHIPQLQPADRSPPISHRFQCNQCDAKFKINSDLERHSRVHSNEKPYKCELCKYRCAMKTNLKSHVQLKHSIFDSFHCSKCDFQCSTKAALQHHSHEHQPTQTLQCPVTPAPPRGRSRSTVL